MHFFNSIKGISFQKQQKLNFHITLISLSMSTLKPDVNLENLKQYEEF